MTSRHILACLLGFTAGLCASGQSTAVTPPPQGWAWTPSNASSASPLEGAALAIPANAQLARSFPSGDIAISVTTRPVFGATSQDWPVLELGDAAVVLSRVGDTGNLTVVIGNSEPVTIPLGLPIDGENRLASPLALSLAHLGSELVVQAGEKTWSFPVAASSTQTVVLSAGMSDTWELDTVSVIEPLRDIGNPEGQSGNAAESTSTTVATVPDAKGSSGSGSVRATADASSPSRSATPPTASTVADLATGASTLEIFTPASVRFGRADALRAALAQTIQK